MMKFVRFKLGALCAALALSAAAPAQAELVVVVGAKSPAANMSDEQVAQVFLGKSQAMTPVDQPESAPIRAEFYKKVAGKDAAQAKALWSKLVFTGKASLPKEMAGNAEVKKAVAADPKAIGYIEKSALDGSVKAVLSVP
jgi:ABC-type phosphate transport system substrate-binding protein